ncbi:MAG TPA: hypothetical protein DFR83_25710, partial [Deltaproteobacteria bacterium]|nr:hypothetical protein [Deltaproteobacteria bacterium]
AYGADPCELPTDLAIQAEQAVIEARFDDMNALLPRFEASLSCAPAVDPLTLAAFFRAEGAWFHLTQLPDEAHLAFQSAARLAPSAWTPAFGEELRAVFQRAAAQPVTGEGSIRLEPPPADPHLMVYINGAPSTAPTQLSAGLHALQLIRSTDAPVQGETARFGTIVAVFPDEDIRVNPGVLPIETPRLEVIQRTRGPIWLLASAGGAWLVSGVTAAVALNQPNVAQEAQTLAEVNRSEQRQRRMAVTSYSLFGAGAVATGLYFAW